ncbi:MAG: invasion associated locus B family protein [Pseudomonadota bacterium]
MSKKITLGAALYFIAVLATSVAHAQDTKVIQKFNDWVLYSHAGNPANICFLTAQPRETKPAGYAKERSYFYVSSWPNDGVKAEISVKIGKNLQNGSKVNIQIGSSRYSLFTKGDKAFVEDPNQELKLIDSMKRGSFMFVRGTTADGTAIEDVYSLSGVTAAVNTLSQNGCG